MLTRRHGFVAQIRIAGENALRFLIRVFREIPQDENDLVLHVERRVAVVAESLALRHHDAVAGKHHWSIDVAVVRERERANWTCGAGAAGPKDDATNESALRAALF